MKAELLNLFYFFSFLLKAALYTGLGIGIIGVVIAEKVLKQKRFRLRTIARNRQHYGSRPENLREEKAA